MFFSYLATILTDESPRLDKYDKSPNQESSLICSRSSGSATASSCSFR